MCNLPVLPQRPNSSSGSQFRCHPSSAHPDGSQLSGTHTRPLRRSMTGMCILSQHFHNFCWYLLVAEILSETNSRTKVGMGWGGSNRNMGNVQVVGQLQLKSVNMNFSFDSFALILSIHPTRACNQYGKVQGSPMKAQPVSSVFDLLGYTWKLKLHSPWTVPTLKPNYVTRSLGTSEHTVPGCFLAFLPIYSLIHSSSSICHSHISMFQTFAMY